MGAGHVEQIGCLLCRQLCVNGHHLHGVAIGQFSQDVDKQAQSRGGQLHLMRLLVVVKDLNVLRLELGCQIGRQGTLTLNGGLHLCRSGKGHLGLGSGGGHG